MKGLRYKRVQRIKSIRRKKNIAKSVYQIDTYYPHDGMYDKGKIHCSCPMCADKRSLGRIPRYEERKNEDYKQQLAELNSK